MKGFIAKSLCMVCMTGGLLISVGCCPHYSDLVDPCWPERYRAMARKEVHEGLDTEVQNGHILDQTVWNNHFEQGTAKLTPGGLDHLQYLVRRRPCPDTTLYLQTALDVSYDPNAPDRYVEMRNTLNSERVASVERFVKAEAAGRNLGFNVVVHDPAVVDLPGITANNAMRARVLQGLAGSLINGVVTSIIGTPQAWQ